MKENFLGSKNLTLIKVILEQLLSGRPLEVFKKNLRTDQNKRADFSYLFTAKHQWKIMKGSKGEGVLDLTSDLIRKKNFFY